MGILDIFKKRKKRDIDKLDEPLRPKSGLPEITRNIEPRMGHGPDEMRSQIDLLTAQMQSLRLQYEAINSRLQNIERLVTEIRGFCR